MSTSNSGLLFEVAPFEDTKKKKPVKRKAVEPTVAAVVPVLEPEKVYGYLAVVDGHYKCDQCGLECLDLIETRKSNGKVQWLVTCGWWCMHSWLVDPIPGLLDEADESQKKQSSFVVKGGRYDGQTFDEIADSGHLWYIEQLVKAGKRTYLAAAAAEWLASKKHG